MLDLEITKRGKPDDSDVPEELRKNVTDPLTAFFHCATTSRPRTTVTLLPAQIFDGRRRYDVEARMVRRDRAWIAGRQQRVIKLALTLEFIAGADTEDLEEVAVEDDQVEAELLLSADERLLPLRMRILNRPLGGSIELLQDCSSEAGCRSFALTHKTAPTSGQAAASAGMPLP